VATGAIIFRDLELSVRVDKDGRIDFSVRDRENRSQILVSEMMILANSLFAHFLTQHNLPGIFRSQQPASEKIELGEQYDPVLSYRSRKVLAKGDMGPDPAPHSTLGLDCYTTATSPLRRYQDLLVQRQIKSFLETGKALLDRPELEGILLELSYPLERASVLERERTRYFLLKYLQAHRDENFEAVVLQRFPRFHLVQIVQFGLNAALMTPDSLILNPYDKVLVRIEKIRPREDKLSLSLVRLL
jgi:exoribonuclease-2